VLISKLTNIQVWSEIDASSQNLGNVNQLLIYCPIELTSSSMNCSCCSPMTLITFSLRIMKCRLAIKERVN